MGSSRLEECISDQGIGVVTPSGKCHSPCILTTDAIWITGSTSGSGNTPFRPAHSISKLRTRNGAISDHSPSGGWLINLSWLQQSHIRLPIRHLDCNLATYDISTSYWAWDILFWVCRYCPAGSSIQLEPGTWYIEWVQCRIDQSYHSPCNQSWIVINRPSYFQKWYLLCMVYPILRP